MIRRRSWWVAVSKSALDTEIRYVDGKDSTYACTHVADKKGRRASNAKDVKVPDKPIPIAKGDVNTAVADNGNTVLDESYTGKI